MRKLLTSIITTVSLGGIASPAMAEQLIVFAAGDFYSTWNFTPPVSPLTAPSGNWQFSFIIPDTINSNPTTQISGFEYLLNGAQVPLTPTSIEFFSFREDGLFDLNFANGLRLSLTGPEVLQGSTIRTLYFTGIQMRVDGLLASSGGSVGIATYVPEPATWALLALGFAAMLPLARCTSRSKGKCRHS